MTSTTHSSTDRTSRASSGGGLVTTLVVLAVLAEAWRFVTAGHAEAWRFVTAGQIFSGDGAVEAYCGGRPS